MAVSLHNRLVCWGEKIAPPYRAIILRNHIRRWHGRSANHSMPCRWTGFTPNRAKISGFLCRRADMQFVRSS